jgi:hypothetical protein
MFVVSTWTAGKGISTKLARGDCEVDQSEARGEGEEETSAVN